MVYSNVNCFSKVWGLYIFFNVFERSLVCSPRLLYDTEYSNNIIIVKYYNLK